MLKEFFFRELEQHQRFLYIEDFLLFSTSLRDITFLSAYIHKKLQTINQDQSIDFKKIKCDMNLSNCFAYNKTYN